MTNEQAAENKRCQKCGWELLNDGKCLQCGHHVVYGAYEEVEDLCLFEARIDVPSEADVCYTADGVYYDTHEEEPIWEKLTEQWPTGHSDYHDWLRKKINEKGKKIV
jgi:hypothetical protein